MLAKTTPLYSISDHQQQGVAIVTEVVDGQACQVSLNGERLTVCAHLHHVDYLQCGDQVLICSSLSGVIIVGRLRTQDEQPEPPSAAIPEQLELEARQSVCLKTANGRIEIHGDGKILINGRQIVQQAEGPLKLQGAKIELN